MSIAPGFAVVAWPAKQRAKAYPLPVTKDGWLLIRRRVIGRQSDSAPRHAALLVDGGLGLEVNRLLRAAERALAESSVAQQMTGDGDRTALTECRQLVGIAGHTCEFDGERAHAHKSAQGERHRGREAPSQEVRCRAQKCRSSSNPP